MGISGAWIPKIAIRIALKENAPFHYPRKYVKIFELDVQVVRLKNASRNLGQPSIELAPRAAPVKSSVTSRAGN
jgi:hypothetical protein